VSAGPRLLATVRGAIACDAFRSRDDGLCHAIVLSDDGQLTDVVYEEEGTLRAVSALGAAGDARDVTAFWSDVDDVRNVITVSASGEVSHFRQKGEEAWTRMRRRDVPDAIRVAGYDEHHHGIVLTERGRITDEPFHGVTAAVQQTFVADTAAALEQAGRAAAPLKAPPPGDDEPAVLVATVPGALDIAALWADGQNRFVIAADEKDAVLELGYGIHQPETRRVVARISGVRRISACYLDDPAIGRCVVALTRDGEVHVLRYGAELGRAREALTTRKAEDIACFPSANGGLRIVLVSGGDVLEFAVS
jgi:hypothetical protein